MSSPPWDADRPLTLETARAVIAASFPGVDAGTLTHLGSGWEFDAFLTGDARVFRFPRRAHCEALVESERRVLDLVSRFLPPSVAVPVVEYVGGPTPDFPYRIAGHRFIPGVAADAVHPDLLPTLAREIGAALGAIHSIPEEQARAAGVDVPEAGDEGGREWFERGREGATALRGLDPAVDRALDWLAKASWPFATFGGPLRLVHQDLSPEHVIVDPATGRLAGIIDWTDAILGDPARDFVFLVVWRGHGFAEEVLRAYPPPVDDGFRPRLRFMARLLSVIWLGIAHEQGADVVAHVEGVRHAFAPADGAGPSRSTKTPER